MMQEQKTASLAAVVSEVLQNLAFMFTDFYDAEVSSKDIWLETEIGYTGPARGTLRFHCNREFTTLLAANLLGTDPESVDSPAKANDAAKEFVNILCGQLITALHGTEDVFDLTIPRLRELPETPDFTASGDPQSDNVQSASFSVQGHRMHVLHRSEP
ncbi:MAG: chemotaxis protein CheX [Phycisphaerales bacterium]|nr:MAG: chemotaxis protein CheX [Phycisphaerales bacterium]